MKLNRLGVFNMNTQVEHYPTNKLHILKKLYIRKYHQLNNADITNVLKYQLLKAELHVLKTAIPKGELPLCAKSNKIFI